MSMYIPDKNRRAYVVGRLAGKISKEEANYRPHDNAATKDTCFECSSYMDEGEPQSTCRQVAGMVWSEDTCDLWAARVNEGNATQPSIDINIQVTK